MKKEILAQLKEEAKVYSTTNYDLFKFLKGNRLVRPRNLVRITESMKEKQLIIPIIVNEKMEIIDGQHRYLSSKELGKPVYFIIQEGYKIDDVERANRAGSNWDLNDFLGSFAEKGLSSYVILKDIVDTHGVPISDILKVIAKIKKQSIPNVIIDFKDEVLEITDDNFEKIRDFCTSLQVFNTFKDYDTSRFIGSFMALYFNPKYDQAIMKAKYESYSNKLSHKATQNDYLTVLCNEIYSFRSKGKDSISYNPSTGTFH